MANKKPVVKKALKNIPVGVVCIKLSFNNTIVTITDLKGNAICWSSAGFHGFKGAKKSTPHAAQVITEHAASQAMLNGVKTVSVKVQGPGAGRESALRALSSSGLIVASIKDVTPIAHNGPRPRKRRRV